MKWVVRGVRTIVLIGIAALGVTQFGRVEVRMLTARVDELEHENTRLADFARRLQASRRVAQVDVVKQYPDARDRTVSVLLWQEIGPDGVRGTPIAVEVFGRQVYFEGRVIKFDHERVGAGDPQRGASVVLFRRVFGEQQAPETGTNLDTRARPPVPPGGSENGLGDPLWDLFWELADDPRRAAEYGVRVAQCEAPSVRVQAGDVWEIHLDADGGLNLSKVAARSTPEVADGTRVHADWTTVPTPAPPIGPAPARGAGTP